jgi:hypothetical protein
VIGNITILALGWNLEGPAWITLLCLPSLILIEVSANIIYMLQKILTSHVYLFYKKIGIML